jgi:hypothetical protein
MKSGKGVPCHTITWGAAFAAIAMAMLLTTRIDGRVDDAKPDQKSERPVRNWQSVNRLKQLTLAMHNYHTVHGKFPAAAVFDKDGKPLLSWRVLLLPFLEEGKLFKEFHLDEPWDSEHNKKLLERTPKVYEVDSAGLKPGETRCVVFTGKGTVFEGTTGISIPEIVDGTSHTLMIVESGRPVPWTKPEDLVYDPAKPLPELGLQASGFNGAFCDAKVRWLKLPMPEKELRALITRNGHEPVDLSKY